MSHRQIRQLEPCFIFCDTYVSLCSMRKVLLTEVSGIKSKGRPLHRYFLCSSLCQTLFHSVQIWLSTSRDVSVLLYHFDRRFTGCDMWHRELIFLKFRRENLVWHELHNSQMSSVSWPNGPNHLKHVVHSRPWHVTKSFGCSIHSCLWHVTEPMVEMVQ